MAELQNKLETNSAPAPPPLPPPPPPPPPLLPLINNSIKKSDKPLSHRESIEDMANILGIQRAPKASNVNGGKKSQ